MMSQFTGCLDSQWVLRDGPSILHHLLCQRAHGGVAPKLLGADNVVEVLLDPEGGLLTPQGRKGELVRFGGSIFLQCLGCPMIETHSETGLAYVAR